MPTTIRQTITLQATPAEVFETLMDSKKHSRVTGARARISRSVGGKFSAYDGYIEGANIELVRNKKIVQMWRGSDWPADHYSKTTFSLKKVKGGTKLTLRQSGVPADQYASIKQGWIDFYWKPMKKTFRRK